MMGAITLFLIFLNTVFWNIPFYVLTFFKIILPFQKINAAISLALIWIAENWISSNNLILAFTQNIQWDVEGLDGLSKDKWYLILCNHQSWSDILVLQKIFNRRIPFIKFFLKEELKWVPILGVSWWALDYPFMKRFSKAHLEKHPEDKGKDLETTRKKCERFKGIPTSVLNFVEGTRFTPAKAKRLRTPYQYLLPPKAGGLAFMLGCMGSYFSEILDVTVAYPGSVPLFWNFLSRKVPKVKVRIRRLPIDSQLVTADYSKTPEVFYQWTDRLWTEKDRMLHELF